MALTSKQRLFVKEYLVDLNATQAAIRAGYSKKTAGQIGEQNLKKLEIQQALTEAIQARAERVEITQDYVLSMLVKNIERAMQEEEIKIDGRGTGEFKYNGAVANKALELLGKHLGMFKERIEYSGDVSIKGIDFTPLSG